MNDLVDSTGKSLPPVETPSADLLRAYGDAMFLAFRSRYHSKMNVGNLRAAFEPPLVFGQYKIFRFDGVPRAILTWANLSKEAERKYISGEGLLPSDWNSESGRLWVIDIIAPYRKLMSGVWDWGMVPGNLSETGFLYIRPEKDRDRRRVVEVRFDRRPKKLRLLDLSQF